MANDGDTVHPNTQLTHKVRNPRSYNEWMEIWTATVEEETNNITITPSASWKIPAENIDGDLTVSQIRPDNTAVNVVNTKDSNDLTTATPNHLIQINENSEIINGPEIDPTSPGDGVLTSSGEWKAGFGETYLGIGLSSDQSLAFDKIQFRINGARHQEDFWLINLPEKFHLNQDPQSTENVHTNNNTDGSTWQYIMHPIINLTLDPLETDDIANGAITTAKLADGSVTADKLGSDVGTTIQISSASQITGLENAVRGYINTKEKAGAVTAGGNNANKVWKTDVNGNPDWRDDVNTNRDTTYTINKKTSTAHIASYSTTNNANGTLVLTEVTTLLNSTTSLTPTVNTLA